MAMAVMLLLSYFLVSSVLPIPVTSSFAKFVQPQKHVQSRVPSNTPRVLLTAVLHRKQVRRAKATASLLDLLGTRCDELAQLV